MPGGRGVTLVGEFPGVLYVFGAFLVLTRIKMWLVIDSVPAIFTTTSDRFIVFTSKWKGRGQSVVTEAA